ncbi:hypothetical protein ASD83_05820 [Devosia sp. Root685]|uniref:hypothetical protein n=1 Tax=Devosia sp. Root685 TaxID=1736587 RepID=UPI0006F47E61|nr:hypothetical protein [Devosia sp. Root685]KRA99995.1 hypothetical protein ASD83_05820 [Devosia sp. Root685]
MKFLPMLPALLLTSPAAAQNADPHSVFTLRGECQTFVAGTEDLTSICAGEVLQVVYTDSRMDLSIWTDDPSGRFFVLSGTASAENGNLALAIDQITEGKDGSGNNNVDANASGKCMLAGDPTSGPAQYTCEATDAAGKTYKFALLTDGSAPENMLD